MEVGPTCHYMMGGVRVNAETQESSVPGLFAAGEVGGGLHGANRLGGNSLSDLLVFGKRAGEYAAKFSRENSGGRLHEDAIEAAAASALTPLDGPAASPAEQPPAALSGPYQIQQELQHTMQDLVGIVRREEEMVQALDKIAGLKRRAEVARVEG